jgi:hypothetical protein
MFGASQAMLPMAKPFKCRCCLGCIVFFCSLTGLALHTSAESPSASPKNPCSNKPDCRQLDFWVGEWDVMDHGKKIATSSIRRIIGDCVIFENYSQPDGYSGKSFNFFDATLGKWRQTWVDTIGNVSEFTGEYSEKAMRFQGETHRQSGERVLRRLTLFDLGPDRVRQYSERSVDGGKTWSVAYDYIYIRQKSATR